MRMALVEFLGVNALIIAICIIGLWLVSLKVGDVSFIDSWWPVGMVVLAWVSFLQAHGAGPRRLLLVGLCTLWGLRLGIYLFLRWRQHGADRRYVTMIAAAKAERGWGFATSSLLLVFALQAPLQFVVCLPSQLGQFGAFSGDLTPLSIAGAALAVIGILFESIGDWQLSRFKANPENKGKVLDTGLWRFTRHPNYFGDACVGWGLFLIAAESPYGLWSLPAPALLTFLLTRWSGVPTVEGRMRKQRPDYEAYVARTSSFIPWPPKSPA
jgi:steroid 5-alpha reductase family enzyme